MADKYFTDINELIFVIDVQRSERFNEAIEYLSNILTCIKQLKPPIEKFYILFHKVATQLFESGYLKSNIDTLNVKLKPIIDEYKPDIITTSIYAFNENYFKATQKVEQPGNKSAEIIDLFLNLIDGLSAEFDNIHFKMDKLLEKQNIQLEKIEETSKSTLKSLKIIWNKYKEGTVSKEELAKETFKGIGATIAKFFVSKLL